MDMDDHYIVNMIKFLKRRRKQYGLQSDVCIAAVLEELLEERGMSIKDFPTMLPYQTADGTWFWEGRPATEMQIKLYKMGIKQLVPAEVVDEPSMDYTRNDAR
jgi:hypothetical protein